MGILDRNKSGKSDAGSFKPQLTSLVDVMTILLVFLIKSFSAEQSIITPSKDLSLPVSASKELARQIPSIEISENAILSDGKVITRHEDYSSSDSLVIEKLFTWVKLRDGDNDNEGKIKEVMIQSDRDVEFNIIKRVMFTCSKAGISDFTVMVLNEE